MTRGVRKVAAAREQGSATLVAVHLFRTVKRYDPALWSRVVPELDRNADRLAKGLKGRVTARETIQVAGDQARSYLLGYGPKQGRYTFLFRGRTEFELICQWAAAEPEPAACGLLVRTFRPA